MMNNQHVSDELLNAFVDNELSPDEESEIFDSISRGDALKERICELRGLKKMVRHAYPAHISARSAAKSRANRLHPSFHHIKNLAACIFLLLLGGTSGWIISESSESKGNSKMTHLLQAIPGSNFAATPDKIIVHVSNSNPVRLKTALDETESLLENYKRDHRPLKVEIIANSSGVDLLRSDVSPYATRIGLMKAKYPNLDFLACSKTISNLQKKGVVVHLLPHTGVASSAVEQINKRLLEGWDYVRV